MKRKARDCGTGSGLVISWRRGMVRPWRWRRGDLALSWRRMLRGRVCACCGYRTRRSVWTGERGGLVSMREVDNAGRSAAEDMVVGVQALLGGDVQGGLWLYK